MKKLFVFFVISFFLFSLTGQHSIARQWNEEVLESIRRDFARPTVHARNLWYTSLAMYDIWSVVGEKGTPYFLGDTIGNYVSTFGGLTAPVIDEEKEAYISEAISYAMYDLIRYRFQFSPGAEEIIERIDALMDQHGYLTNKSSLSFPEEESAVAFGRYVASELIAFGRQDGANEQFDYRNLYYEPVNDPLLVVDTGNVSINDPNHWQPLGFELFVDQSGNSTIGNVPEFLGPEWGAVMPFSLKEEDLTLYTNPSTPNFEYYVYHNPGAPPYLTEDAKDQGSADFKWGFALVAIWSGMLDPTDGVVWDISPGAIGNIEELPRDFEGYKDFFKLFEGGDESRGHALNPVTNEPYESQLVPRADYARVLAEFWADGPDSETPPGHWFTILHAVMDHPLFQRMWEGQGAELTELEYDIKAFFTLSGAMHDVAITAWGIKGWYDYVRPISVIRYMASKGQSTDTLADNYSPHGLPLVPGHIEVISEGDPLALENPDFLGKIKLYGWRGPGAIENPETDVAGVGWTLAEHWWPYQRPTFVSPPFAGYISGHSCFSRAAAEILTMMTGDEFFPGGIGAFPAQSHDFLVFESGPSVDMELQWATYRDASDQTSLSRIWGGIHPPQDDIPGRLIGIDIGIDAFNKATSYFGNLNTATVDKIIVEDEYFLYPNPVSSFDRLQIKSSNNKDVEIVKVILYDNQARKVRSEIIRPSMTSLDLKGLSPGNYILHIIQQKRMQISKFVIVD